MPGGKTHDTITILLVPAVGAASYMLTQSVSTTIAATAAFLFGGLMFGPDLDTVSKQYSRWLFLRILWLPYRKFFPHRSRWSHGLIFGTLLRVVYFMGAITLAAFLVSLAVTLFAGGKQPHLNDFAVAWGTIGAVVRTNLGTEGIVGAFLGMWLGAASHTFTDMAGSYIKTGRITEFL